MKKITTIALSALLATVAFNGYAHEAPAADETPSADVEQTEELKVPLVPPTLKGTLADDVKVNLNLELLNLFTYRNDADFDRSSPYYNEYDQSEGFLATFLMPRVTITKSDYFKFYYETEIGTDLWSYNTPDAGLGKSNRSLSMKQREIWGHTRLGDFFVKAGFQRVTDSSRLFIDHWVGAARFGYGCEKKSHVKLSIGQLPDQTFEGWDFGATHLGSFGDDVMLAAVDGRLQLNDNMNLDAGFFFIRDGSVINRVRNVGTLAATFSANYPKWMASASLLAQFGNRENFAANGDDTGHTAYAASAAAAVNFGRFQLKANLVALSPDDEHEGNDASGFLWSGKRNGQSSLLNENTIRDIGDNIDEKLGIFDGLFYEMTPGMAAGDIGLYMQTLKWMKVGVVSAGLMTLNSKNSMDSSFVGWENELVVDVTALDGLFQTVLTGGVLLPGEAGAAFVNILPNRTTTDPLYFMYLAVFMRL